MSRIVSWCLGNRSVVVLITLMLLGGGAYAATQLNQELLPDIEFPLVTVQTPVPDAGPDVVDEQVTQVIEGEVEGTGDIESIESTSTQGFSFVAVEFALETDTDEAEQELQSALEGVELPEQAQSPEVAAQSAADFPVMNLSLQAGDRSLTELTEYAEDEVVPDLEEVDGVSGVELLGGSERQIPVDLDTERLREKGVAAESVVGAISEAQGSTPVGEVEVDGLTAPVVTESGISDVEELRQLPVGGGAAAGATTGAPTGAPAGASGGEAPQEAPAGGSGEQKPVLLEEVADVSESEADLAGISRSNGEPSVGLSVTKEREANTVEVSDGVREALDGARSELGSGGVNVVLDSAEDVEDSVSGLIEKALLGAAFAVVVIFVFLRSLRATLVTAVALPTSVLAALLFSWGEGLTLNILTLAGLTIAVGRVVDDAIVVLENSYRYIQEQGMEPEEAARRGTSEVASAITSSTLCTAAVFLPLGLVGGIVSEFFLPLSLTVAFALLASLIVSVTIIPVLVSLFIKSRGVPERDVAERDETPRDGLLVRLYTPALRWSLRHRAVVLLAAFVLFAGGVGAAFLLPSSFFPASESRTLAADVELEDGLSARESADQMRPFEDFLLEDRGVESYQLSVGGEDPQSPEGERPDNQTQTFISLEEDASVDATLARVQERGEELYGGGFRAEVQDQSQPPAAGELEVAVSGGSEEEREDAAGEIAEEISGLGGLENVESDATGGGEQISADVDPQRAAEAGLSSGTVSQSLATLLGGGLELTLGGETPVAVGVPDDRVDTVDEVRGLPVGTTGATLSDVAEVEQTEAPSAVSRADGEPTVTVSGTITGQDTNAVSEQVRAEISALDLPEGVDAAVGGESEEISEGFGDLFVSIAVALALVFVILVVFFGSVLLPLVILLAVPLTTIGAFGALLLTGTALSLPSLLGVLLLIGIVVANSILLIDFVIKARERNDDPTDAIVEAGRARLRPILMTAIVTIFALLPLALGFGGGAVLISNSLAIPVIGGLITSTLLTLLVVPAGYSALESARERVRLRREKRG